MKRVACMLLCLGLLVCLSSCFRIQTPPNEDVTEPTVSSEPEETTEAPLPENHPQGKYDGLKIVTGSEEFIPLSFFWASMAYEEDMWLAADGFGAYDPMVSPEVGKPYLVSDGALSIVLSPERGTVQSVSVYDTAYNRQYYANENEAALLNGLPKGQWYVIIGVMQYGDYIEAYGQYETCIDEFLFMLIVS